jgi:hypothetical protein
MPMFSDLNTAYAECGYVGVRLTRSSSLDTILAHSAATVPEVSVDFYEGGEGGETRSSSHFEFVLY